MPFLLRREGIPVEQIGRIESVALASISFVFLLAPITDMIMTRRNWVIACNFVGAVLLVVAILLPRPASLGWLAIILALSNLAIILGYNATLGLMAAVLPDKVRGKGGGWFQVGNMGSGPLMGGLCLILVERLPLLPAAIAIGVISFLPSTAALLIREPSRPLRPSFALYRGMLGELRHLFKQRRTWLGLVFFLSPAGTGALTELFSALGVDYHVSPGAVQWVNGIPGGVIAMVAGAYAGGVLADRFSRRFSFLALGALNAAAAAVMALGPLTPATYVVGALLYQMSAAMVLAAMIALQLELGGNDALSAATRMALFTAAANVSVAYMPSVDGWGSHWGSRGVIWTDALCGLVAVALCLAACRLLWPRDAAGGAPLAPEAAAGTRGRRRKI
jgi:MFS family permease